jgi:CheY-like chemotaxis protein
VGDAGRLRQILLNLLSNAVKFTERGEVVLTVAGRPLPGGRSEMQITVRDTGIGIPPDRMDRLFQSFSQVDASVSRRYGGTGLGLAISRRLAELMDGSLTASSTGVAGEGTTFQLIVRAPVAADGAVEAVGREPGIVAGKRALVVDDNATNRRILELQLGRWRMEARVTGSPEEAVEWLRAGEDFDVAVLDLHMEPMDGVALAGALRALRPKKPLPVIILSSVGAADRNDPSIVASLTKPVKPSSLHDALAEALGAEPAAPRSAAPAGTDLSGMGTEHPLRILLAEDNAMNRRLALILLERMGYAADVAVNGREAVEAVERAPYDVVLMDIQMPEMDGLEATRQIRARWKDGGRPRIVALTANAMAEDREMTAQAGMDDYLSKPIRPAELADALRRSAARTDA